MDVWGERKELKKFTSFFKGHSLASSKNKLRRAYGRQNRRREEDQDGYSWEMLPFHWPTCMKSKPSIFLSLDISPSSRLKKEKIIFLSILPWSLIRALGRQLWWWKCWKASKSQSLVSKFEASTRVSMIYKKKPTFYCHVWMMPF